MNSKTMEKKKAIQWINGKIRFINQLQLPHRLEYRECNCLLSLAEAIKNMQIRGAPLLGIAAAMGLALVAKNSSATSKEELWKELEEAANILRATRPTAVNLFWALDRMLEEARKCQHIDKLKKLLLGMALKIQADDEELCRKIAQYGSAIIKDGHRILTHCNTGMLATGGEGTALGIIKKAHRDGKNIHIFVDETRPALQGARLTAWELMEEGISMTLITDNMAGYFMASGKIDLVIVGADRITSRGDVANKIGTYTLAVLAKEHHLPFYVAAPSTTIDLNLHKPEEINIENRPSKEVTHFSTIRTAPFNVKAANPAFDITPASYITGLITEKGIFTYPFEQKLMKTFREEHCVEPLSRSSS